MKVNISDMPEEKEFNDYPEDTVFVHNDNLPRYDRDAIMNNKIVRIFPNDPRYENAMTREEIMKLSEKSK